MFFGLIPLLAVCPQTDDLFCLDNYYGTTYEYAMPKQELEGHLSGWSSDHPSLYSEEERTLLYADLSDLYEGILSSYPSRELLAVITAGAPGAGKTTLMRRELANKEATTHQTYAYVCPDDVCLTHMTRTYQADITSCDGSYLSKKAAYDKWRPGSLGGAYLLVAALVQERYAFYFGITSSRPEAPAFFSFLKDQGYYIKVLHLSAPEEVRLASVRLRNTHFVHTPEREIRERGLLLPQRISDTFLAFADEIDFYYRDKADADAILAARWTRITPPSASLGTLTIIDNGSYEQIKALHNTSIKTLNRHDLLWESTLEKSSQLIWK